MNKKELIDSIISRIIEIEDEKLLHEIDALLNNSNHHLSTLLAFVNEKLQHEPANETEDFTAYIKEWVKSM